MLKKILFISFLFISFLSKAQSPPFQKPITFGYELSNLLVDNLAGIPNDTFAVPTALRPYAWIARKSGALYLWNSTTFKWEVIVGSGGSDGIGLLHVVGGYGLINVNDSTVKVDTGLIAKVSRVYNINDSMKLVNAATYVPLTRTITINGVSHDLSSNPSWSVGTLVSSDTTGKWIWAQGNFATMTKQQNNAWYDSSRHQYLRVVGNDSTNLDWLADNQSGTWALFQGKRLTIRDLDTVTSANDDWPFANNVNGIVERITRLVNTRSTAYRHNLFARQVYEVGDSSYVYSIGGDAGSALHSATFLTNIPGTAGRQVIQGGSVPFDAVPVFVSTLTTGPKDEALGISSRRARGYWAPITAYSNAYAGDTVDHLLYFNATGYDAGAKYLSKTGLYIPIDNNASRTALSWGVYSSDVTGGNSYNLFGGRVGIGDNFGTHTSPSFKSNASFQVNSITRGVIFPRMTAAQRLAISVTSSDSSLIVFDLDSARYMVYTGTAWKGIAWTGEGGGGGGISSLASVGGGLDIQTGGAGNIRTLNTGEFDAATNLISLKTGGIANSKLTNSTISGKSLGSNLDDLTAGFGLLMNTGTTYNGSAAKTERVDTSSAGVASWQKPYQLIDSLKALGWGAQTVQYQPWYQYYIDITGSSSNGGHVTNVGTGSLIERGEAIDNWMGTLTYNTGTTNSGFCYFHFGNSGGPQEVNINSSYRYNYGVKLRVEDLSDGTDTYRVIAGFGDDNNTESSIVDGAWFSYTSGDSSGVWVCKTRSNSSTTAVATATTVAADTDYELEISIIGGTAYFYINKVLATSIATNIPSGATRATSMMATIKKSAGTTNRKMYIEWLAYGKRSN